MAFGKEPDSGSEAFISASQSPNKTRKTRAYEAEHVRIYKRERENLKNYIVVLP
jgi:hypothetical protein